MEDIPDQDEKLRLASQYFLLTCTADLVDDASKVAVREDVLASVAKRGAPTPPFRKQRCGVRAPVTCVQQAAPGRGAGSNRVWGGGGEWTMPRAGTALSPAQLDGQGPRDAAASYLAPVAKSARARRAFSLPEA